MTDQSNYLTVVYQINDSKAFEDEHKRIMNNLYSPDTPGYETLPWCVVRMSVDHEIHRLELIEMAREEGRLNLIGEILDMCGVDQIISLDDLIELANTRVQGKQH